MRGFRAFWMSFSMFCALPSPYPVWDETLRPLMTVLLGLVGVCIGAIWVGVAMLCQWFALPPLFSAALLTITPWLVSGFIHLDGFMDCTDAILSRRDLAERRRILKDSSCGAFSVIAFVCLALVSFGALTSWNMAQPWTLLWIATLPRCLSGLAVLRLPPISTSQYAQVNPTGGVYAVGGLILLVAVVASWCYQPQTCYCGLAAMVGWTFGCWRGYRSLQGMSGDISGYAITLGETFGLVALALI